MTAQSYSIPAPTGGWNARDPLDLMAENDAVRLVNAFPDVSKVRSRKGFTSHQSATSNAIQTLVEYAEMDGTRALLGASNGHIYDYTTASSPSSLGSGFTNNKWQTATYLNIIVFVNGTDQPQQYNGTSLSAATYTGIADDSVLIQASVYKNRLYFVEKNSTSIWYGGAASVTGAVTKLDIGDVLKLGGRIYYAGSVTHDTGSGLQDLFCIITDKGEVITYSGTNPSDWAISGRYFIPAPLGEYRCAFDLYGDLAILTENGVFPLSAILTGSTVLDSQAITNKIQGAFTSAAKLYGSNFGWHGFVCPRSKWLIINVPLVAGSTSHQYCMNLLTGAWCKFTGMNANCFAMLSEEPYFATASGAVFKADNGTSDNGAAIEVDIKQAFNYFQNRSNIKQFLMSKPILTASGSIEFQIGFDVDNQDATVGYSTVGVEAEAGASWGDAWGSEWAGGNIDISNWYSVHGLGRSGALKFKANLTNVSFDLTASHVTYKVGGFL